MNTFHSVTLQNEVRASIRQCPLGTRMVWPLKYAIRNRPIAPVAVQLPRNVQTGISASASFIIGQFNPQPRVSVMTSAHMERGRVWDCADIGVSRRKGRSLPDRKGRGTRSEWKSVYPDLTRPSNLSPARVANATHANIPA